MPVCRPLGQGIYEVRTDLTRNPEHRQWLADFYEEARLIDPTRLIVDNSACRVNFHVAGDIEDYHEYRAIPDHAEEWLGLRGG